MNGIVTQVGAHLWRATLNNEFPMIVLPMEEGYRVQIETVTIDLDAGDGLDAGELIHFRRAHLLDDHGDGLWAVTNELTIPNHVIANPRDSPVDMTPAREDGRTVDDEWELSMIISLILSQ